VNHALIVIYILWAITLLVAANQHGKKPENNFWITLARSAIHLALVWWALGWRFI
jgi:hypothetical protein